MGITEHMPPVADAFVYPEEKSAGLNADTLKNRFADYMRVCRHLKSKYARDVQIYVGFETESLQWQPRLGPSADRHLFTRLCGRFRSPRQRYPL